MEIKFLMFIVALLRIDFTYGRLIQKNKTRNVEDPQTEKPNPSIRLTRAIENYSLLAFSREESAEMEEFIMPSNRRARQFRLMPTTKIQGLGTMRIARESMEKEKDTPKIRKPKKEKPSKVRADKSQTVLVKKPVPEFTDSGNDNFHSMMTDTKIIADSYEHEDNDFNLGDYDFDVNNDVLYSGRKPLEPIATDAEHNTRKLALNIIKNVVIPEIHKTVSNKKQRAAKINFQKSLDINKEIDYYDDTTTTKAPENVKQQDGEYSDADGNEEIESSLRTMQLWSLLHSE